MLSDPTGKAYSVQPDTIRGLFFKGWIDSVTPILFDENFTGQGVLFG